MTVKEHYDKHLCNFYSWMSGDFEIKQKEFQHFLSENNLIPASSKIAIDLGAGHGIKSIALAKLGFIVKAIDFNTQLLNELKNNAEGLDIDIIHDDIRNVEKFRDLEPEVIICCGDTLTHLDNKNDIENFIKNSCIALMPEGKMILSFRDYSNELTGDSRFIPVKSDHTKILTCVLDYQQDIVRVTDLLHEMTENGWEQKVSSYNKVRISTQDIVQYLVSNGMTITFNQPLNRMQTIIAVKN